MYNYNYREKIKKENPAVKGEVFESKNYYVINLSRQ